MNKLMQYALAPLVAVNVPFRSIWDGLTYLNQSNRNSATCDLSYTTEIVSLDPLAMYINNFIKDWEIIHLLELTNDEHLFVYSEDKHPYRKNQNARRTASSCLLPDSDPVVKCVIQRASGFVGFINNDGFEALQIVKYLENERHDPHFDWFLEPPKMSSGVTCNRVASFFVYLGDEVSGGETCFHGLIPAPNDADPKKFGNVNSDDGLGFAVKPIKGNAMFWMNLYPNNTGDPRVRHSALPVKSGVKYGMNILLKRCWQE